MVKPWCLLVLLLLLPTTTSSVTVPQYPPAPVASNFSNVNLVGRVWGSAVQTLRNPNSSPSDLYTADNSLLNECITHGDSFGASVAAASGPAGPADSNGDVDFVYVALAGAPCATSKAGFNAGGVALVLAPAEPNKPQGEWSIMASLTPSTSAENDLFGSSVDVAVANGVMVAVVAGGMQQQFGKVYVFQPSPGVPLTAPVAWDEVAVLTSQQAWSRFGTVVGAAVAYGAAVAKLPGVTALPVVAVSAPWALGGATGTTQLVGAAYVHMPVVANDTRGEWSRDKLQPTGASNAQRWGTSMSLGCDSVTTVAYSCVCAIGSVWANHGDGAVRAWGSSNGNPRTLPGVDATPVASWPVVIGGLSVVPSYMTPVTPDEARAAFGTSVATDGTFIVVGAKYADRPDRNTVDKDLEGVVYVFSPVSTGWFERVQLKPPYSTPGSEFGLQGLAVAAGIVSVGVPQDNTAGRAAGGCVLFRRCADINPIDATETARIQGDTCWQAVAKLTPPLAAAKATPAHLLAGASVALAAPRRATALAQFDVGTAFALMGAPLDKFSLTTLPLESRGFVFLASASPGMHTGGTSLTMTQYDGTFVEATRFGESIVLAPDGSCAFVGAPHLINPSVNGAYKNGVVVVLAPNAASGGGRPLWQPIAQLQLGGDTSNWTSTDMCMHSSASQSDDQYAGGGDDYGGDDYGGYGGYGGGSEDVVDTGHRFNGTGFGRRVAVDALWHTPQDVEPELRGMATGAPGPAVLVTAASAESNDLEYGCGLVQLFVPRYDASAPVAPGTPPAFQGWSWHNTATFTTEGSPSWIKARGAWGVAIALSGRVAAIAVLGKSSEGSSNNNGAISIFVAPATTSGGGYNAAAAEWLRGPVLVHPDDDPAVVDPTFEFGPAVALSRGGSAAAVGSNDGGGFIFAADNPQRPEGNWSLVAVLDSPHAATPSVHARVGMDWLAGVVVTAAPAASDGTFEGAGVVLVWQASAVAAEASHALLAGRTWRQTATLMAQDGTSDLLVGSSLALAEAGTVVVAGAGKIDSSWQSSYVFRRSSTGTTWAQVAKLSISESDGPVRDVAAAAGVVAIAAFPQQHVLHKRSTITITSPTVPAADLEGRSLREAMQDAGCVRNDFYAPPGACPPLRLPRGSNHTLTNTDVRPGASIFLRSGLTLWGGDASEDAANVALESPDAAHLLDSALAASTSGSEDMRPTLATNSLNTRDMPLVMSNLRLTWIDSVSAHEVDGGLLQATPGVGAQHSYELRLRNCELSGGQARRGGAIYGAGAVVNLDMVVIKDCAAPVGGAVMVEQGSSLLLRSVTMVGNTASQLQGGALALVTSHLDAHNSVWVGNTAASNGGAIHAGFESVVEVRASAVHGNAAGKHGGGVYLEAARGVLEACNVTNNNNNKINSIPLAIDSAGGGLFVDSQSAVTVAHGQFVNNRAVRLGGAVGAAGGNVSLYHVTLQQHNSAALGGAVGCQEHGEITMNG